MREPLFDPYQESLGIDRTGRNLRILNSLAKGIHAFVYRDNPDVTNALYIASAHGLETRVVNLSNSTTVADICSQLGLPIVDGYYDVKQWRDSGGYLVLRHLDELFLSDKIDEESLEGTAHLLCVLLKDSWGTMVTVSDGKPVFGAMSDRAFRLSRQHFSYVNKFLNDHTVLSIINEE